MNKRIELIKEWILKRDLRDRIILFLLSLLIIYSLWFWIVMRPVNHKQTELKSEISRIESERAAINQQYDAIMSIVNSPEFESLLGQQKQLTQKSKDAKQRISGFTPVFVSESDFPKLTKDILSQLDKNIALVRLQEFPNQRWVAPEVDKSVAIMQRVNQHKLTIEFRANYFETIAYLSRLEKLPWHWYWDTLEYKVTKYPEANVVVQLYVLSQQKDANG